MFHSAYCIQLFTNYNYTTDKNTHNYNIIIIQF